MILPKTIWYPKQNGYIHGTYMYKNVGIEIESIMISYDSAKVFFNTGMRRINMDANEFRKRFER